MNAKLLCATGALATVAALSACSLDTTDPQINCNPTLVVNDTAMVKGDTVVTTTGLKYVDVAVGTGTKAEACSQVITHYEATILGQDSVVDQGALPPFIIGTGYAVQGFEQGVVGMKVGGERILIIPPNLAYGANGFGDVIPPNATLIFDVTLDDATEPID